MKFLLFIGLMSAALFAQVGPAAGGGGFAPIPTVTGPTPHLPGRTPDLGGAWMGGGSNSGDISKALKTGDTVKMLPWAQKVFDGRMAKDDPEAACLPFGVPRSAPYPFRIRSDAKSRALIHRRVYS